MIFKAERNLVGLAIVGIAVVGCGSTTPVAPESSSPSVVKDARYGSVTDLKDAAVLAGLPCPTFELSNQVESAAQSATCSDDSVLSTFATDADLQKMLANYRSSSDVFIQQGIEPSSLLVGQNWVINASEVLALQPIMGGVVDDPQKSG
jgi:hypothetical protein